MENLFPNFTFSSQNWGKEFPISLSLLKSGEPFFFQISLSPLETGERNVRFLFLFSKLEKRISNFSFSSQLDFLASRQWLDQSVWSNQIIWNQNLWRPGLYLWSNLALRRWWADCKGEEADQKDEGWHKGLYLWSNLTWVSGTVQSNTDHPDPDDDNSLTKHHIFCANRSSNRSFYSDNVPQICFLHLGNETLYLQDQNEFVCLVYERVCDCGWWVVKS